MRELSLEEQELVAGGAGTTDPGTIVDPYPGDDPGGDWGDWGDYGDSGGVPGDSGGGTTGSTTTVDNDGDIVVIDTRFDPGSQSSEIVVQVKDAAGPLAFAWDMPKTDSRSLTLHINDGSGSRTGSVMLTDGMVAGTYAVTFANGVTGSLTLAEDAGGTSVRIGINVTF